ncbi:CLIP domain-containing serine protease HP8-like [Macrosteles quadrilineatus]|uniref:CLIP domain-containing serine protease HP8-like n=1 Tax=Macrosteles quadrilineatus TaxID=74068 RepID=UPI0023E2CE1C|nr:CLIP domain-containing serine protease HP8-like [Macrosteles quadrilineatus]
MILLFASLLLAADAQHYRADLVNHANFKLIHPYQEECGQSLADRIIGGINASLGQYPWLARLGYSFGQTKGKSSVDVYECGGAIITDRYILSAAHCSPEALGIKLVQVRLGEYDTETDPDCVDGVCAPPVQDVDVESHICHPNYNKEDYHNDICLIRLATPIQFNDFVQPICLPIYELFLTNTFETYVMEVAGWGVYNISIRMPHKILQTVKVPIANHWLCELSYSSKAAIHETQFCAGGIIGRDSCSGDSGGPLMRPFSIDAPPKYFLVGIVSFGPKKCAETDSPGVYTKASDYMKWILDNIAP